MPFDPTHPRTTPADADDDARGATAPQKGQWMGVVIDGRYRIDGRLAAGGMGEVFRATHVELGRPLALKMMKPELSGDASFVDRFRREAMTASRLGHPHIVDIIDSGRTAEGQFYFVMEFLEGESLTDLIARGPVEPTLAFTLVSQMAEALDSAHKAGVIHRDLKPDNVIVLQRGGRPFVKLVDFGLAKAVSPSADQKQTTVGIIMGTPQYMAPEQAAGLPVDSRADLYALGLVLYELLMGEPPLTGETASLVMAAHISTPAPRLPDRFPSALRDLVARMLAKHPDVRPASMAEVVNELRAMPATVESKPSSRRAVLVAGSVLAMVALAAGVSVAMREPPVPSPPPVAVPAPVVQPPAVVDPAPPAPVVEVPPPPAAEPLDAGRPVLVKPPMQQKSRPKPTLQKLPPAPPPSDGIQREYPG
jgi:eukaryotic-like serine/threonine-protein kinase